MTAGFLLPGPTLALTRVKVLVRANLLGPDASGLHQSDVQRKRHVVKPPGRWCCFSHCGLLADPAATGRRPPMRQHHEELAFNCGLHRTDIRGVERGIRNPTVLVLQKIADALGIEAAQLLESIQQPKRR